jgi:hypothetical protein
VWCHLIVKSEPVGRCRLLSPMSRDQTHGQPELVGAPPRLTAARCSRAIPVSACPNAHHLVEMLLLVSPLLQARDLDLRPKLRIGVQRDLVLRNHREDFAAGELASQ